MNNTAHMTVLCHIIKPFFNLSQLETLYDGMLVHLCIISTLNYVHCTKYKVGCVKKTSSLYFLDKFLIF